MPEQPRPSPPPLEVQYPLCPMCDTDPRCPAIDGRWLPGGQWARQQPDLIDLSLYTCLLTENHDASEHRYADFGGNRRCWGDEHSATPQQLAEVHRLVHG